MKELVFSKRSANFTVFFGTSKMVTILKGINMAKVFFSQVLFFVTQNT
jgi:hypothetical protein